MTFFIICVLAIIALGIYVTVKTKSVRPHDPMSIPTIEEEIEDPTSPIEIDLGIPNPPKHQNTNQTPERSLQNAKMSAKPKRKYNKKKSQNQNKLKN